MKTRAQTPCARLSPRRWACLVAAFCLALGAGAAAQEAGAPAPGPGAAGPGAAKSAAAGSAAAESGTAEKSGPSQSVFASSLADLQYASALLGYVYAAPLFELAVAEYRQVNGLAPDSSGPRGMFAHLRGGLPDHETSWFSVPNPDVLYSSAWLYLQNRPYVIYVPPMDDVWYSVQFEDYFMNNAGYLSYRNIGSGGGFYLVAYRSWDGPLPWGVRDVIEVPTPVTWILLRIAATKQNEAEVADRYQRRFRLVPLEVYLENPRRAKDFQPRAQADTPPPVRALNEMRGKLEYFQVADHLLRSMDIPKRDEGLVRLLDVAGLGSERPLDLGKMSSLTRQALTRAAADGARIVHDMRYQPRKLDRGGWSYAPSWLGVYGSDYLLRAIAAYGGIGANNVEEAVYPNTYYDSKGRLLDGRYDYRITFHRSDYPPAAAFWSLAAYSAKTKLFMQNSAGRYGIGSTTEKLQYGEDGSLSLLLSNRPPRDEKARSNWLPIGTEPFFAVARLYLPLPPALDGSYSLPPLERIENDAAGKEGEEEANPLF